MFGISLNNKLPIYEQLMENVTRLVLNGVLEPNEPLPSVRELAAELAVNPNTVQKAFTELERSGVAYSVSGKGRFVTDDVESLKKNMIKNSFKSIKQNVDELIKYGVTYDEFMDKMSKIYKEGVKWLK